MILPTIANLEPLTGLDTVSQAVAWADDLGHIAEILPVIKPGDAASPTVLMPGDEGYEQAIAASS